MSISAYLSEFLYQLMDYELRISYLIWLASLDGKELSR